MIIGLPRSLTTWAANWLSGPGFTVAHDPLYRAHYSEWAERFDAVSCTGIWRWPEWVNAQRCRKLVLRRNEADVITSLKRLGPGMHAPVEGGSALLDQLRGPDTRHVPSADLLDVPRAEDIWTWLRPAIPFDTARHDELIRWKVEPSLSLIAEADTGLFERLLSELRARNAA